MLSANPSSSRFMSVAILAAIVSAFGLQLRAQEPPSVQVGDKRITGLPSDWSHRHVIYADPGTEQDAVKNGTHEQWDRVVHDPRYIFQQLRKDLPVRGPAAQDVEIRHKIRDQERRSRDDYEGRRHHSKKPDPTLVTMHRDWSMNTGGSASSITITIPTAGSGITSGTSNLVINAGGIGTITASGPATQAGTFTFSASGPGTGSTLVIGGMTYNFTNSTTITTTPGAGICTVHETFNTPATAETNLLGAMNASSGGVATGDTTWRCGARTGQQFAVSSSVNTTTHTITVAANLAGATGYGTPNVGTTGLAYAQSTAASDGTSDGTHFTYWTGSAYDTAAQLATSLTSSINANGTVSGNVTAVAGATTITITADAQGSAGNAYTVAASSSAVATGTGTLSGGALGSLPAVYPAKFAVSSASSVNCSNATQPDYVVYSSGIAGSASSATLIAYDNLYANGCTGTVPTVYWAYNTGTGSVVTSPILSYDGTKVAFIETPTTGAAVLRVLNFKAGDGTDYSSPFSFTPSTNSFTNTAAGAGGNTPWTSCPAGSCMISAAFQSPSGNQDTNSSPFYDYNNDVLYVGDDSGKLHKFSGVFFATPAEVTTGGWPVTLAGKLTSPVLDPSTGSLFVGSSNGFLYQITTPTGTPTKITSGQVAAGLGIVDSPIVDSTSATPFVYVFVGDDNQATIHSAVIRFTDTFTGGNTGVKVALGATATGNATLAVHDGDFDNTHYNGNGTNGNLYLCAGTAGTPANPTLWVIPINAGFTGTPVAADTLTSGAATCSPATEFYNTGSGGSSLTTLSVSPTGISTTLRANITTTTTTTIPVSSAAGWTNGDYALIDSEYVLVTASSTTGLDTLTANRGALGSTAATHSSGATVTEYGPLSTTGTTVKVASGASIQNGDYIQIDSEIMEVTAGGGTTSLTVTRHALGTTAATHTSGANITIPALDWLFLSVTANGSDTVCTGACLYSFYIGTTLTGTAAASDGLNVTGGTSGLIIDNGFTSDGASQIYYTPLAAQTCTGSGGKGTGTGACAIQASQAGLQ